MPYALCCLLLIGREPFWAANNLGGKILIRDLKKCRQDELATRELLKEFIGRYVG